MISHLSYSSVSFLMIFSTFLFLLPGTHLLFTSGTCCSHLLNCFSLSMLLTFSTFLYVVTDLSYTSFNCYSPSRHLLYVPCYSSSQQLCSLLLTHFCYLLLTFSKLMFLVTHLLNCWSYFLRFCSQLQTFSAFLVPVTAGFPPLALV
jgi:hypothetical protein